MALCGPLNPRRFVIAALLGSLIVAAVGAGPAKARPSAPTKPAGCGGTVERPFLRWLDPLEYTLAPDGGFEGGASGWSLKGGAMVVSGNEPFLVSGAGGVRSLLLPPGSSATSPPVCMELGKLVLRFFTVRSRTGLDPLRVQVVFRGLLGILSVVDGGVVLGTTSWQPTLPLPLLISTLTAPLGTKSVQLRFVPAGGTSWRIDDVYVDPWILR